MSAKTQKSSTLKQGTLSFASSKRTASAKAATHKPNEVVKPVEVQIPPSKAIEKDIPEDSESDSTSSASSEELPVAPIPKPAKKAVVTPKVEEPRPQNKEPEQPREELDINDKRWRKQHAATREKMGHLHPIHAEGQNKVHEILRVFDMSYEYGPCIGMSRLERWQRAKALGLNPPEEVREILETKQGTEQTEYSESVLYTEV